MSFINEKKPQHVPATSKLTTPEPEVAQLAIPEAEIIDTPTSECTTLKSPDSLNDYAVPGSASAHDEATQPQSFEPPTTEHETPDVPATSVVISEPAVSRPITPDASIVDATMVDIQVPETRADEVGTPKLEAAKPNPDTAKPNTDAAELDLETSKLGIDTFGPDFGGAGFVIDEHQVFELEAIHSQVAGRAVGESMAAEPNPTPDESVLIKAGKTSVCFDPSGDLFLKVGNGSNRTMLVDSRALSRASPKLKEIIFTNHKDNADNWTLELPEDDRAPFVILLNLIHARFENVPAQVSINQLYGICVLTNKYNMVEVLRPVAERWYRAVGPPSEDYGPFFKKAFVAWELGFAEDLSEMGSHVVLNCSLDKENQLVIGEKRERLANFEAFRLIPILDCIADHRELVLETIWDECQKLSGFVLESSIHGHLCEIPHRREEICLMLGKMLSKAGEEGILDLFTLGTDFAFCRCLCMDLKTLEYKVSLVADYIDLCGWCRVVFVMMDEVRGQLRRAADPLYLNHFQAMSIQATKIRMMPWVSESDQDE
ncbi:hypothetical protein F53441_4042 [Fusarium austroafricanum]|uniref:BTB domain-containing protein n=1 Tax=Fusarium austroafricanum TaxID=2364996 RepID=A0A8H4KL12_9HYPO|nr:hypothetical protein F53441_4042 [Fusarium austroafricanum]